jgi:hypothetical protein
MKLYALIGRTLRIVVLAMLAMGSAAPAIAQNPPPPSPETLQAAKELVSVVSSGMIADLAGRMVGQVWPGMETALRAQNPKIDAATVVELRDEFQKLIVGYVTEIMNDMPAIYARYLTAQEMREIVAFYRTPTGAKALKVMPQATADSISLIMPRLQGMQEKANLAFLTILQKRGYYAR